LGRQTRMEKQFRAIIEEMSALAANPRFGRTEADLAPNVTVSPLGTLSRP
jgi:hypothetical protein